MAVVFISPKKKQRRFLMGVGASFLILILIVFFFAFARKPSPAELNITFNKPKVTMNFGIFNTDEFNRLEMFESIPFQFFYIAQDSEEQEVNGIISAESKEEARTALETAGLTVVDLQDVEFGRDNPFIPF